MSDENQLAIIGDRSTVKYQKIAQNLVKLASDRMELLIVPEVAEGLSEKDMRVAVAGTNAPIKSLEQNYFVPTVKNLVYPLCQSIGIQLSDDPTQRAIFMKQFGVQFLETLRAHYSELSLNEIKLAFMISMTGELDEFLPKRDGDPDKGHYQKFSTEYVTRILNAYRKRKKKAFYNVKQLVPPEIREFTKKERTEARKEIRKQIVDKYRAYKKKKEPPHFVASFMILKIFEDAGICKGIPKPTAEDLTKALAAMHYSISLGTQEKKKLTKKSALVKSHSQIVANNGAVVKLFDTMIAAGLEIEDVLPSLTDWK